MKALRYHAVGSLDHVTLDEVDVPVARDGEALVKVVAAGVNPIDAKIVASGFAGQAMPRTLGIDFAGTVVSSARFASGARVFGSGAGAGVVRDGAFAEYVAVDEDGLVALPESLSFEQAAALGVVFLTAHLAIVDGPATKTGETVVVHGAGGGVGSACVQIASRVVGARTIAVVSGEDGAETARALGAHETIDRRRADVSEAVRSLTDGNGANVIVDVVGGAVFEASVVLLQPFGRLVSVGLSAGAHRRVQFDLVDFYRANRRIVGVNTSTLAPAVRARMLAEIASWIAAGKITPPALDVLPLARGAEALARMVAVEGAHGKVVLRV